MVAICFPFLRFYKSAIHKLRFDVFDSGPLRPRPWVDHREGGARRDFGGVAGSIERVLLECHGVHEEAGTDRGPLEAEDRGRRDAVRG